jgi:hypothetical protein
MTLHTEIQSTQDSLDAVYKLRKDLESKFIEMGQLFAHIKATKIFRFKGYESFRDYVEQEHNIGLSMANKLIKIQNIFVNDMDQDEETLKEIGMDRLIMIAPLVAKSEDWAEKEELLQMAYLRIPDLKAELKERKESAKAEETDLKQVFVQQFQERFTGWFNCSVKELQFKLALYFSDFKDQDLEIVKKDVKLKQHQFEAEVRNADR